MGETLERALARSIAECDKDFRPIWTVNGWDFARAAHIIERMETHGFKIVKIKSSVSERLQDD